MADMETKHHLPLAPSRVGPPRLDPYTRILARFYEPLFLLRALGQTRGEHTPQPLSFDLYTERRRRFLENLCYVCDFKKGGDTCTAIGLEDCRASYRFWVASTSGTAKIVAFLNDALDMLCNTADSAGSDLDTQKSALVQICAEFAAKRVKEEQKLLLKEVACCISKLSRNSSGAMYRLFSWLQELMGQTDKVALCKFAYDHRHSEHIHVLAAQAVQEETRLGPAGRRSSFALVRHYIGRLAQHIRAPAELIEDSHDLGHLLQTYEVCGVEALSGVRAPMRDSHTNLRGILHRMCKGDEEEKENIEDGLVYMNSAANVFEDFMALYEQGHPQVHAEIQCLEHFYQGRFRFADGDRFIACSKPACLCCELYFKYHPARMVVPASHRKVWTRWSPPLVKNFGKHDVATQQQKQILSKITQELRDLVITQALESSQRICWHPDSRTCITEIRSMADVASVEEQVVDEELYSESVAGSSNGFETKDQAFDSDDGGVSIHI